MAQDTTNQGGLGKGPQDQAGQPGGTAGEHLNRQPSPTTAGQGNPGATGEGTERPGARSGGTELGSGRMARGTSDEGGG